MDDFRIRPVHRDDLDSFLRLMNAHADFEKMDRPSEEARQRLVDHLLSDPPKYQAFLASIDGRDVGYAVTYEAYSSFVAHTTLFLEDIFVESDYRGRGFGRVMFDHLVEEAIRSGCGRMEWMVQSWNEGAIRFYERRGGERVDGWHTYRIEQDGLHEIADEGTKVETFDLAVVGAGDEASD